MVLIIVLLLYVWCINGMSKYYVFYYFSMVMKFIIWHLMFVWAFDFNVFVNFVTLCTLAAILLVLFFRRWMESGNLILWSGQTSEIVYTLSQVLVYFILCTKYNKHLSLLIKDRFSLRIRKEYTKSRVQCDNWPIHEPPWSYEAPKENWYNLFVI